MDWGIRLINELIYAFDPERSITKQLDLFVFRKLKMRLIRNSNSPMSGKRNLILLCGTNFQMILRPAQQVCFFNYLVNVW